MSRLTDLDDANVMLGYEPYLHGCFFNVIRRYTVDPKSPVVFYLLLLYVRERPWPKVASVVRSLCSVSALLG